MAKTEHNPINTLWHGQVGGIRYRVLRGKQVISSAVSHMTNRNTPAQQNARGRFKAAVRFTDVWLPLLKANLRKVEDDAFEVRSKVSRIALNSASYKDGEGSIDLWEFAKRFNMASRRRVSGEVEIEFDERARRIRVPAGNVVVYEVTAYNPKGLLLWRKTLVYVSDGDGKEIELPDGMGDVSRLDLMAFNVTLCNGAVWRGPVGEVTGRSTKKINGNIYCELLEALSGKGCRIHGVSVGSVGASKHEQRQDTVE